MSGDALIVVGDDLAAGADLSGVTGKDVLFWYDCPLVWVARIRGRTLIVQNDYVDGRYMVSEASDAIIEDIEGDRIEFRAAFVGKRAVKVTCECRGWNKVIAVEEIPGGLPEDWLPEAGLTLSGRPLKVTP